jgi:hypothetical protein
MIRGYGIQDLMDKLDFGSALFVLFQGRLPEPAKAGC